VTFSVDSDGPIVAEGSDSEGEDGEVVGPGPGATVVESPDGVDLGPGATVVESPDGVDLGPGAVRDAVE